MDEALRRPLLRDGIVVTLRDRDADADLESALRAVSSDALLSARVTGWSRPTIESPESPIRISAEVLLLVPGSSVPAWRWSVKEYPLQVPEGPDLREAATRLFANAGSELARFLEATGD